MQRHRRFFIAPRFRMAWGSLLHNAANAGPPRHAASCRHVVDQGKRLFKGASSKSHVSLFLKVRRCEDQNLRLVLDDKNDCHGVAAKWTREATRLAGHQCPRQALARDGTCAGRSKL